MAVDWLREYCLSLAYTTEQIQWEDALVFKVGGKMYAVAQLEPAPLWVSLKCSDEGFAELVERPGVIPAPYLARARWVAIESEDTLSREEIKRLLVRAHDLVFANLPKKIQAKLSASSASRIKAKQFSPKRTRSG